MTRYYSSILILLMAFASNSFAADFNPGEKLQLLSNLHPDVARQRLYTMNYQLADLIPMCAEVTVVKKNKKKFIFEWKSVEYTMLYDKHTKKSGVSFDEALQKFFGNKCDADKVKKLSEIDRKGIRKGIPYVGMTKQGVLYAMGHPPPHANPDLDGYTWMYWLNRFKRKAIDFNEKGIVEEVRL